MLANDQQQGKNHQQHAACAYGAHCVVAQPNRQQQMSDCRRRRAAHRPHEALAPGLAHAVVSGAYKIARRLGYAAFGVLNGTEVNPDFAKEVRAIVESAGADKTVVLYCSQGGVLESKETHKRGWQTRSLVAAYDLTQDGISNVQVLRDGYTGWINAGRDIEILEYEENTEEVTA